MELIGAVVVAFLLFTRPGRWIALGLIVLFLLYANGSI